MLTPDDKTESAETVLESECVYRGKVFSVEKNTVRLSNGATAMREVVRHIGAVCVLPLTHDGRVPVEYQWRAGYGGTTLEIPAGKLNYAGEDPLAAAKRELREETGAVAEKWIYLGSYYGSPAILSEKIEMYLAEGLTFGETAYDEDEIMRVEQIPLETLVAAVMRGEIPDGKTQCAVLRAYLLHQHQYQLQDGENT